MTCHRASLSLPLCQVRTELQTTSSKKRLLVHRPPGISVSSRRILSLQLTMQAFAYFAYFASSWIHWAKASAKAALSVSAAGSSGRKLRPQAVKMDGRSARRQALCKPLVQRAQAVNQAAKKVPRKRLSNTWRIKIAYLQKLQYNKFYRSTGTVRL